MRTCWVHTNQSCCCTWFTLAPLDCPDWEQPNLYEWHILGPIIMTGNGCLPNHSKFWNYSSLFLVGWQKMSLKFIVKLVKLILMSFFCCASVVKFELSSTFAFGIFPFGELTNGEHRSVNRLINMIEVCACSRMLCFLLKTRSVKSKYLKNIFCSLVQQE